MKLGKTKQRVKVLLTDYSNLRDDYAKLCVVYWSRYDKGIDHGSTLQDVFKCDLTSPESITRASRSLQKEFVDLRGSRYGKTEKLEEEYKEEFSRG
jgi:hypothetical protein|tara:strand:- start:1256 stop:1543 length:288 start_codon:yes stop_codon:yes gene_type:complete